MFEIGGLPEDMAREALTRAAYKLSVRSRIVTREELTGE
jgi:large subunit ribosomal protein L16